MLLKLVIWFVFCKLLKCVLIKHQHQSLTASSRSNFDVYDKAGKGILIMANSNPGLPWTYAGPPSACEIMNGFYFSSRSEIGKLSHPNADSREYAYLPGKKPYSCRPGASGGEAQGPKWGLRSPDSPKWPRRTEARCPSCIASRTSPYPRYWGWWTWWADCPSWVSGASVLGSLNWWPSLYETIQKAHAICSPAGAGSSRRIPVHTAAIPHFCSASPYSCPGNRSKDYFSWVKRTTTVYANKRENLPKSFKTALQQKIHISCGGRSPVIY